MSAATVLVVEDNRANMKLACLLLASAGYKVLQAFDAETGIAMARTHGPDLILMDVQLPGMDGLSATRELKRDPATRNIGVVALTGRAMHDDQMQARDAGCDAYVAKPFEAAVLLEAVARTLGRYQ